MRGGIKTVAIFDEEIEGVVITVVSELAIARGRKLLETLSSNRREITGELCILSQNHSASGDEAVDKRFLTH